MTDAFDTKLAEIDATPLSLAEIASLAGLNLEHIRTWRSRGVLVGQGERTLLGWRYSVTTAVHVALLAHASRLLGADLSILSPTCREAAEKAEFLFRSRAMSLREGDFVAGYVFRLNEDRTVNAFDVRDIRHPFGLPGEACEKVRFIDDYLHRPFVVLPSEMIFARIFHIVFEMESRAP